MTAEPGEAVPVDLGRSSNILVFRILLVVVLGAGLAMGWGFHPLTSLSFVLHQERTDAVVLSVERVEQDGDTTDASAIFLDQVVEYRDLDGKRHIGHIELRTYAEFLEKDLSRVGRTVTVYYDAAHPERVNDSSMEELTDLIAAGVVGVFLLAIEVGVLIKLRRLRRISRESGERNDLSIDRLLRLFRQQAGSPRLEVLLRRSGLSRRSGWVVTERVICDDSPLRLEPVSTWDPDQDVSRALEKRRGVFPQFAATAVLVRKADASGQIPAYLFSRGAETAVVVTLRPRIGCLVLLDPAIPDEVQQNPALFESYFRGQLAGTVLTRVIFWFTSRRVANLRTSADRHGHLRTGPDQD
jgi:hypothetical protein